MKLNWNSQGEVGLYKKKKKTILAGGIDIFCDLFHTFSNKIKYNYFFTTY